MDFVAGAIGGGLSTAVGYPLDTVKVRIQTERHYNGIWHCIQETYRTEKVWGFYKGVSASVFTVSVISSVSFGTYKNFLCTICKLRYGAADAKPSKLDVSLAGGAAGAVRVVLMTPSEVAKVRMQTQRNPHPSVASPQPVSKPKYRGSLHCLKVIAREEGFGGLYKGCSALLCRDCSSSAIYFLTYSALCDWLTPAGKNKPGRYWEASDITCKTSLFSTTLRGKSGSQQTSPSTYKTSPRFSPRVGLFPSWHHGAICALPARVSTACVRGLRQHDLVPQQLHLSLCEGCLRHALVPSMWV
ncbi:solute carrier family 25 member 47 isoform X3 [Harpia harpyja]|uniref:solute carrier family 25 member 47 isoform X3 n=1 Tax=Harpia harpyja TaxID=202280 RepID=UPI0022B1F623|nr:solute carrier family 25 member 47 isoform X3 [Harpia harpyja]